MVRFWRWLTGVRVWVLRNENSVARLTVYRNATPATLAWVDQQIAELVEAGYEVIERPSF